ncbi:hypothetical protein LUZ61_016330 [Rhynchospora tenuis]|uniref:Ankyrin n=1 Tax=Rhynchospora tenuis TaxID=198213 RepID=A0AAD6EJV9_9POAL|nr:hypothetical protein LUZ61_016330 [Rhynchospora tenuis]
MASSGKSIRRLFSSLHLSRLPCYVCPPKRFICSSPLSPPTLPLASSDKNLRRRFSSLHLSRLPCYFCPPKRFFCSSRLSPPFLSVPSSGVKVKKLREAISSGNLVMFKELAKEFNEAEITNIKNIMNANGFSAFHLAASHGRTNICQYFVEDLGFHVDLLSLKGETPLFYAVVECHEATAKYLISRGANPALSNNNGISPLHHAVRCGHIKLVKYLLSLGVPVDGALEHSPFTPLMLAAQCGQASTVEILLQHHADVNHVTSFDDTPLLSSLRSGSLECIKLLIKAGADLNLKCPLAMAVQNQSIEVIKCLLEAGADPNVCNPYEQLPIETAIMSKNWNVAEMLLPLTSPIQEVDDWSVQGILQYVNSEAFFQKNKEVVEDSLANFTAKGHYLFMKKEYRAATVFYSKGIEIAELIGYDDVDLYSHRSFCWHRLREGDQALEDALMAHKLSPESPKAYYCIGAALMLLEDYKKASEAFLQGLQLVPTNTQMREAHREALECMMKSCFGEGRVN